MTDSPGGVAGFEAVPGFGRKSPAFARIGTKAGNLSE